MPYDYWSDLMQEREPQAQPDVPQSAPVQAPVAAEPAGYDYASDLLSEQPGAAPGGQLTSMAQTKMPEYETAETQDMSLLEQVKEMWTGDKRRAHDWAEVPVNVQSPSGDVIPIQDHMSLARDNDMARVEIFTEQLPEAADTIDWDENMNPFTTYFGEPRYLNRPGASLGDLSELITQLPAEYLAARTGAGAGKPLGLIGQIVGAGGALFGTSITQDKFAQIYGSNQPVDWKRAQMMGLFGAGGEAVGMAMGKFFQRFFSQRQYIKKDGSFTDKGRAILEKQGIDPDSVTKEFRDAFINMTEEAVEPKTAVTMAEAETLPKRVRLTKGEALTDVRQQQMEQLAGKGALGQKPYETMDQFKIAQRKELEANRDLIQAGIGMTDDLAPTVTAAGEGMGAAQEAMRATRMSMHRAMKNAYQEADRLGMRVDVEGIKVVRDHIMDSLNTFPRRNNPVRDELLEMNQVVQQAGKGPRIKQVTIKEMEDLRSRLTSLTQSTDPQTAQAARTAVKAMDDGMKTAIDMGAYTGKVDALKAYMRGRQWRAEIGRMFEKDNLVKNIMEPTAGPYSVLRRPPNEAANLIFTGNALGFNKGSENALKLIRSNLLRAGDQQAWNSIREEAVWRLFKPTVAADIMSDGSYAFSGKRFATAFDKAMRDHKRIMNVLFTPQELGLLRQFRNVAVRATVPLKGAENYSNTAVVGARLLENVFGQGARIVQNAMRAIETVDRFGEGMRASAATAGTGYGRGFRPDPRQFPAGSIGGLSAIGAAESERRQGRMSQQGRRRLER